MEEDDFILVPREHNACCSHDDDSNQGNSSPEYLAEISEFIDSLENALWSLNAFIHANPELAFQEYKAHQALTNFLRSREEGWQVTPSAYGIETAWIAVYDSGQQGPAVSFNVEMGRHFTLNNGIILRDIG
jgi:hypothetical protein